MNPQTSLQPVFNLLQNVATKRMEGCCAVCDVLEFEPTISRFLQERENEPIGKPFATLLEGVSDIVQECEVKRTISDWPFEHFWENPIEPKHSKFLAYFIDPKENHGYGKCLLKGLFKACNISHLEVDDECKVTSEKGRIDFLVLRKAQASENKSSNSNYAVIFENKINGARDAEGAVDTKGQLDTYVERIKKQGIEYADIHVLYLPLRADKDPKPEDEKAIIEKGVKYVKITFETQIRTWLESMVRKMHFAVKHEGMRDNLISYKNLITYLVNKNRESNMNTQIIEQLKGLESRRETLPTLEAVRRAQDAVRELLPCLQIFYSLRVIKAEFPKELQAGLKDKFPLLYGEAVGLEALGTGVTLWFGYDLEDAGWFFGCEYADEKCVQCLDTFMKKKLPWMGNNHLLFRYAVDFLGPGFETLDLSPSTAQIAAKKILEWRDLLTQTFTTSRE